METAPRHVFHECTASQKVVDGLASRRFVRERSVPTGSWHGRSGGTAADREAPVGESSGLMFADRPTPALPMRAWRRPLRNSQTLTARGERVSVRHRCRFGVLLNNRQYVVLGLNVK